MRAKTTFSLTLFLVMFLVSCSNNSVNKTHTNSVETVAAIVNATLSAIPTSAPPIITKTIEFTPTAKPTEEIVTLPTNTPIPVLVPLYWEVTWENLGRSVQDVLVNQQTNERISLAGYIYQAPLPSEKNDLTNHVNSYYSEGNMANIGWTFVSGWGGVEGILTEFYNEGGYYLTVRTLRGESSSITVWISDQTTIAPALPPTPNQ